MRVLLIRLVVVFAVPLALSAQANAPVVPRVQVQPGELKWNTGGGGISTAGVIGDPSQPGIYVTRLRFAKGTRIQPHLHPDQRVAVVVSGSMLFGYGSTFDERALTQMVAGSTWTEPPDTAHFGWAKDEEVVIQVVGLGPSGSRPPPKY